MKSQYIYHVTNKPTLVKQPGRPIHFGTLEQAQNRSEAYNYGNDARYFKIQVNPNWKVYETTDAQANMMIQTLPADFDYDVLRYKNEIEGPGYSYIILTDDINPMKMQSGGMTPNNTEAIQALQMMLQTEQDTQARDQIEAEINRLSSPSNSSKYFSLSEIQVLSEDMRKRFPFIGNVNSNRTLSPAVNQRIVNIFPNRENQDIFPDGMGTPDNWSKKQLEILVDYMKTNDIKLWSSDYEDIMYGYTPSLEVVKGPNYGLRYNKSFEYKQIEGKRYETVEKQSFSHGGEVTSLTEQDIEEFGLGGLVIAGVAAYTGYKIGRWKEGGEDLFKTEREFATAGRKMIRGMKEKRRAKQKLERGGYLYDEPFLKPRAKTLPESERITPQEFLKKHDPDEIVRQFNRGYFDPEIHDDLIMHDLDLEVHETSSGFTRIKFYDDDYSMIYSKLVVPKKQQGGLVFESIKTPLTEQKFDLGQKID